MVADDRQQHNPVWVSFRGATSVNIASVVAGMQPTRSVPIISSVKHTVTQ